MAVPYIQLVLNITAATLGTWFLYLTLYIVYITYHTHSSICILWEMCMHQITGKPIVYTIWCNPQWLHMTHMYVNIEHEPSHSNIQAPLYTSQGRAALIIIKIPHEKFFQDELQKLSSINLARYCTIFFPTAVPQGKDITLNTFLQ